MCVCMCVCVFVCLFVCGGQTFFGGEWVVGSSEG